MHQETPSTSHTKVVPVEVPRDGMNKIEIRQRDGSPSRLAFLDLAMPVEQAARESRYLQGAVPKVPAIK